MRSTRASDRRIRREIDARHLFQSARQRHAVEPVPLVVFKVWTGAQGVWCMLSKSGKPVIGLSSRAAGSKDYWRNGRLRSLRKYTTSWSDEFISEVLAPRCDCVNCLRG
jgi:hypothetical protein